MDATTRGDEADRQAAEAWMRYLIDHRAVLIEDAARPRRRRGGVERRQSCPSLGVSAAGELGLVRAWLTWFADMRMSVIRGEPWPMSRPAPPRVQAALDRGRPQRKADR